MNVHLGRYHCHRCHRYLPPFRHFELGGYETWLGSGVFEPHAVERILDALLEMAAETRSAGAR